MSTLWSLVTALPALYKLLKLLQARIDEAGEDRKVAADIQTIHEAFDAKDPSKLDSLFNS